jgi:mannan endo-1,4-beta-mannosidase
MNPTTAEPARTFSLTARALFAAAACLGFSTSFSIRATAAEKDSSFVRAVGTHFELQGKPYYFMGTNMWYGMNLGSAGPGGDRARLIRELDRLQSMGVGNLRILGSSEGPDTEPWRVVPALQSAPGIYNPAVLDGLDFLLYEMGRRQLRAVVVLNNFWPWSGGMAQYLSWSGAGAIPYPTPYPGGDWDKYQTFVSRFYTNKEAVKKFDRFLKFIVNRKNPYTKRKYKDDPTIMSWQLANEPRGIKNTEAFNDWIDHTAVLIKSMDKNHLVTTGSEGETPSPENSGLDFLRNHRSLGIDYATMHIWAQNWSWYDPADKEKGYDAALQKMRAYFEKHESMAEKLGKPLVLEEFGLSRDSGSYEPSSSTEIKNRYYAAVFEEVYQSAKSSGAVAGVNFWAWAGEGRARKPGDIWKPGDPFIGDPPHEFQGWYSVYDSDLGTIQPISEYARKLNALH